MCRWVTFTTQLIPNSDFKDFSVTLDRPNVPLDCMMTLSCLFSTPVRLTYFHRLLMEVGGSCVFWDPSEFYCFIQLRLVTARQRF